MGRISNVLLLAIHNDKSCRRTMFLTNNEITVFTRIQCLLLQYLDIATGACRFCIIVKNLSIWNMIFDSLRTKQCNGYRHRCKLSGNIPWTRANFLP